MLVSTHSAVDIVAVFNRSSLSPSALSPDLNSLKVVVSNSMISGKSKIKTSRIAKASPTSLITPYSYFRLSELDYYQNQNVHWFFYF